MILVDRMDESSSPSSGIDALRDLERWLSGQAARAAGISQVERESELRGREILRLALQAHIDTRDDGDVGAACWPASTGRCAWRTSAHTPARS
jgi:hypothetical protein